MSAGQTREVFRTGVDRRKRKPACEFMDRETMANPKGHTKIALTPREPINVNLKRPSAAAAPTNSAGLLVTRTR